MQDARTPETFLNLYNPDRCTLLYTEESITQPCSTLNALNAIYEPYTAERWLLAQLHRLVMVAGIQSKEINDEKRMNIQLKELAMTIMEQWGHLKFKEMYHALRYCRQFKFYGLLDPATVLGGIAQWNRNIRIPVLDCAEQMERDGKWQEHKLHAIPYEEYLRIKQQSQTQ